MSEAMPVESDPVNSSAQPAKKAKTAEDALAAYLEKTAVGWKYQAPGTLFKVPVRSAEADCCYFIRHEGV
eukprot:scaffold312495_cov35-Attheya_sp.AAC.1